MIDKSETKRPFLQDLRESDWHHQSTILNIASPIGDTSQVEDTNSCNEDGQRCATVTGQEIPTESSKAPQSGSYLVITSYGYRLGPLKSPRSLDLIIDVRNLLVPRESVRDKHNGPSNRLKKEPFSNDEAAARLEAAHKAVDTLMENFERRRKSSLSVGVGCGLGRHRSVAFAEELGRRTKRNDWVVEVHHRDVRRKNYHLQQRTPLS